MNGLAWKEYREVRSIVLLGIGLVMVLALRPVFLWAGAASIPAWRYGLSRGGSAVFCFISLVVGALAYAVEEERGTWTVLQSKPIGEDRIFTTKLRVRALLLFTGLCFFGLVLLATGSWRVPPATPGGLSGFPFWLGCLALSGLSLALGVFFGRVTGDPPRALVAAALVLAGLWVLGSVGSSGEMFSSAGNGSLSNWGRAIVLPLAAAMLLLSAARRSTLRISPRALASVRIAALALILYGLLIRIAILLPGPDPDRSIGEVMRSEAVLRWGGPVQVLKELTTSCPQAGHASVPERTGKILTSTLATLVTYLEEDSTVSILLAGGRDRRKRARASRSGPPSPISREEALVHEYHGSDWITRMAVAALADGIPAGAQLFALHLLALQNDPGLSDPVARFLEAPDSRVRILAAFVLARLDPRRGMDALVALYPWSDDCPVTAADFLDGGYRRVMEEWLVAENPRCRALARRWYLWNGSPSDLELIRFSLRRDPGYRNPAQAEQIESATIRDYRIAWASPGDAPILRASAEELLCDLQGEREEIRRLASRMEAVRTAGEQIKGGDVPGLDEIERRRIWNLERRISEFDRVLLRLAELGDVAAIDIWERSRFLPGAFSSITRDPAGLWARAMPLLPHLAALGDPGLGYLVNLINDPFEDARLRFQAAALMVQHGRREYTSEMLRTWWNQVHGGPRSGPEALFWCRQATATLVDLARRGETRVAGSMILNARTQFESRSACLSAPLSGDGLGLWFWNTEIIRALAEAGGAPPVWSLTVWSDWWERAQRELLASMPGASPDLSLVPTSRSIPAYSSEGSDQ